MRKFILSTTNRFLFCICLIILPTLLCGQTSDSTLTHSQLYDLPENTTLADLPLDTALVKVGAAIRTIEGERDFQIKEDLWPILQRAKDSQHPMSIAKTYRLIGFWHYLSIHSENPDSSYYYNQRSLDYYLQTNDKEEISKTYRYTGSDLENLQRYRKAEEYYFEALKIAESIPLEKQVLAVHSYLSSLFNTTKDYAAALHHNQKVLEGYEGKEDYIHPLIRALANQSDIYVHLNAPDKGLAAINKAMELILELPEEYQASEFINIRAWRGNAYIALQRYDEALEDLLFSMEGIRAKYGEELSNGWKGDIGEVYLLKGNCEKAIPYLKAFVHHFDDRMLVVADEVVNASLGLATCYQEQNQLDSALIYLAKSKDLEITTLKEELAATKGELRTKYDLEEKENTIATQSTQIQQQQRIQQLSFGIGALLTLLLGGLFLTYRNNRKKNLQLATLNENLSETNTQLDQRNAQNELLLKEIHHRVKNNLETVSSLLELQSAQIEDDEVQNVMKASQSRVQSMGILHQKLYQGQNLASIEMKDYFKNLAESVLDTYDAWAQVEMEYDMQPIALDVDTAIPVGLIVNELLTNSLKYAFPDGEQGKITLSLKPLENQQLRLVVADNGIGKTNTTASKGTGFGSQLVGLLTRQLNGNLQETTASGTVTSIEFPK